MTALTKARIKAGFTSPTYQLNSTQPVRTRQNEENQNPDIQPLETLSRICDV